MRLDIATVRRRLGDAYTVDHFTEAGSTNDLLLERARQGAPAGTVISADFQSAGRGRRGSPWVAPAGSSVLCSLLLRGAAPMPPAHLAILSGVGVANGLHALGVPAKIKWPNDLIVADRKVAGILVETIGEAVVVGVGVNCAVPEDAFPAESRLPAGSLDTLVERAIAREDVLVAVVQGLAEAFARVEAGGIVKVLYEWNTHNWLSRRKVRVTGPLGQVDGDGLFLDGRTVMFHVFKDAGIVTMPLTSTVEAR